MRSIFCLLLIAACDNNTTNKTQDLSVADQGGDAASCADGDACMMQDGRKGLCQSGTCGACTDNTDDGACLRAYGPAQNFICAGGGCIAGCRTPSDCNGGICGLNTANVCGACTTDAQCQMALGAGFICNPSNGTCVANTCATAGTTCSANSADICCASGGGNACITGNCCGNADCAGADGGMNCVNHVCSSCPSPSPGILVVDPSETTGGTPTGADVSGCRYPTITAAMNAASPAPTVTIKVLGTKTITGTGTPCTNPLVECFPIAVKPGVTVVGDTTMVPTIQVPDSQNGFVIGTAPAALSHLILDGADNANMHVGQAGLQVNAGPSPSPSPVPVVDHVTARNFARDGILVQGSLSVKSGTVCSNNKYGIELNGTYATVDVSSAGDQILMSQNATAGVLITQGAFTAVGTPGTMGSGTVVFNANRDGIEDLQTPGGLGSQAVTLDGIVAWQNTNDGLHVIPGTPLNVHNCYLLGNTANGVYIDVGVTTAINLGNSSSAGHNTLQSTGSDKNGAVGICNATVNSVEAQGNIFSGHDCSVATPAYTVTHAPATTCAGGFDVGEITTGTITVSNCAP